ncbi:MAG: glutaredoxin family protein [Burkholderiales bacterium]
MKIFKIFLWVFLFTAMSVNAAQLYRWVDAKGNVEWRDTPPPSAAAAKKVEQRKIGDNVISTSEAPFSMQLAMKNHPVTFWASPDCGNACNTARTHLNRRGTPYTEKSPQEDIEAFKKLSGGLEVPYLQVGAIRLKGYLESEYENTLDSAGYPRTVVAIKPKPVPPAAKPAADTAAAAPPAQPGAPVLTPSTDSTKK